MTSEEHEDYILLVHRNGTPLVKLQRDEPLAIFYPLVPKHPLDGVAVEMDKNALRALQAWTTTALKHA